jgi:hypothetical protein
MFVYSVNELSLELEAAPADLSSDQLTKFKNTQLKLNNGDLKVSLNEIFKDINPGINVFWLVLMISLLMIFVIGAIIMVLVFNHRKRLLEEEKKEEEMKDSDDKKRLNE